MGWPTFFLWDGRLCFGMARCALGWPALLWDGPLCQAQYLSGLVQFATLTTTKCDARVLQLSGPNQAIGASEQIAVLREVIALYNNIADVFDTMSGRPMRVFRYVWREIENILSTKEGVVVAGLGASLGMAGTCFASAMPGCNAGVGALVGAVGPLGALPIVAALGLLVGKPLVVPSAACC